MQVHLEKSTEKRKTEEFQKQRITQNTGQKLVKLVLKHQENVRETLRIA